MSHSKIEINGLKAVGIVHCAENTDEELRYGIKADIEIFDEYLPALNRISEHSHFWILCWLERANRNLLETYSWHLKENDEPYGVFSLRSPSRPNPISLTLAELSGMNKNVLHVKGLDVYDKTPVLDIKPYVKSEIVFSPCAPYIRPQNEKFIMRYLYKKAFYHHRENCKDLAIAVKMAVLAENELGDLSDSGVTVEVQGTRCFADAIQGITNARLSNPPRFNYENSLNNKCIWKNRKKTVITSCRISPESFSANKILDMCLNDLLKAKIKENL